MALALFETQEQSLDRERRKFRKHVDTSLTRFKETEDRLAQERLREAQEIEQERIQRINFQRQQFREKIAPSMDQLGQDINDRRDRIDTERGKFRDLIGPSLQEAQKLSVQEQKITGERERFRSLIQPSLSALGSVGGGFDTAGGQVPDKSQAALIRNQGRSQVTSPPESTLVFGDPFTSSGPAIRPQGDTPFPFRQGVQTLAEGVVGAPPVNEFRREPSFDPVSPETRQFVEQGTDVIAGSLQTAFSSVIPPDFWEEVEKIPVAGDTLRRQGEFWTSPGGIAILLGSIAVQGVGQTALELAGETGAGALGRLLETEAGAPSGTRPVFEALGGVGAGIAGARGARGVARGLIPDEDIPQARRALDDLVSVSNTRQGADDLGQPRLAGEGASEADNVSRAAADLPGLERDKLLNRINQVLVDQEASSKEIIKARGPEFGRRAASYKEVYQRELAKGVPPQDAAATASRQRAGEFEQLQGIPEGSFSEKDKLSMWNMVDEFPGLQDGEVARAHDALTKLHTQQGLQPNEIDLLGRIYGPEFAENLKTALKTNPLTGLKELAYELSIVPKVFLSAGDVSFLGRQGAFYAFSHPIEWAKSWIPSLRASVSEKVSQQLYDESYEMLSRKYGSGIADTLLRAPDAPPAAVGEVKFGRNLAERLNPRNIPGIGRIKGFRAIPGIGDIIRGSNRAFSTAGNSLRANTFETIVNGWESGGILRRALGLKPNVKVTKGRLGALANQMNRGTMRGKLGDGAFAQFAQMTTWAPQMTVSPVQYIGYLFNPDAIIRQQAWRDFAAFLSAGLAVGGLAKVSGYEVGDDPLSSAFGKAVFGTTRVNIWGPWQVQARFAAQFAMSAKSGATGGPAKFKSQLATGWDFFRSRLAPQYGLVVDVAGRETYIGDPVTVEGEIQNLTIPLAYQDALDAFNEYGLLGGAAVGAVAVTGVSVQTFGGDPQSQLRDMPRFVGVTKDQEREIREVRTLMEIEHDRVQTAGMDTTQSELARTMASDPFYADKRDAFLLLSKDLSGDLPHDPETINFILENASELDDQTLAFGLSESEARNALQFGQLSQEDFDRRSVWIAEN